MSRCGSRDPSLKVQNLGPRLGFRGVWFQILGFVGSVGFISSFSDDMQHYEH